VKLEIAMVVKAAVLSIIQADMWTHDAEELQRDKEM